MKKIKQFIVLQLSVLILFIPVRCLALDLNLQSGVSFDWWNDNHSVSASQLTFPLSITGSQGNLSYRLTSAYTATWLSTGSKNISMNNLLDSKIGATYRLSDVLPFELLVGLDLNLPTGKTRLSSDETKLVMDADLLPVNVYGEGINVNPTITFAKGLNNWTFAVGCGYLWRGSYDFSETLLDYQPGMVINTLAEVRYYYRAKSYTRFFGGYTIYGRDTSEGHDVFNEGNVFQAGVSVSHSIAPDVKVSAGAKGSFREKASLYDKTSGISKDLQAFNGTEAVFDLGGSFALNSTTLLSIPFQARLMTDNGNTGAYYAGAKQKFSLGIGISRELTPSLSADFNLKGFYKHDDETMIPEEIGARSFTGIGVATSLTGRF